MAAGQKILILLLWLLAAGCAGEAPGPSAGTGEPADARPRRIVSLIPAVTEMLFAIGAGPRVVAVSSYDTFPAEVAALPKVGALLDPDVERILALEPDLVAIYSSQEDLRTQLDRAGIRHFTYSHGDVASALDTIARLGEVVGEPAGALDLVSTLEARFAYVRSRVEGRRRPKTLLVFGREPLSLRHLYASGGRGFLHDMLEIAGAQNAFADVMRESVQPSSEMLIARAPEVILEVGASDTPEPPEVMAREIAAWSRLASVPAVRQNRIARLTGRHLLAPGPRLGDATEAFARAIHPDAFR